MNRFSCLPAAVTLAAVLWLQPAYAPAQAEPSGRRTAAEELLKAMHTEQLLGAMTKRMDAVIDKFNESMGKQTDLSEEQIAAGKKAQEEARETIRTQLSWERMKGDAVQAYVDAFTEPELLQLTAFYQTPIGQKLVEKQPEISDKLTKLTQQRFMAVMPIVIQKLRDSTRKNGKPNGSPPGPVGTGTPVSPTPPAPAVSTPVSPTPPAPAVSTPVPPVPTAIPTSPAATPST